MSRAGALRGFSGAAALVTGAGSGIGRAIAEELAVRGCRVVVTDLDEEPAAQVASEIGRRGSASLALALDVRDLARFQAVVAATVAGFGRLDYVFNNAGIGAGGEVLELTAEDWRRVVDVNLFGVIHGVLAAYPVMRDQGFGHIVNTASMQGLVPSPLTASYATTKHAIVGLSKALRAEARESGVRVSVLCPGVIRTPLLEGGKHGVLLRTLPEALQRERMRAFFERFRPMEPARFARKALDGVARNQPIIIQPAWWKLAWWLDRASPSLSILLAERFLARRARALLKAP